MTEYTTIRVSKEAHRAANEAKKDDETWDDYVERCSDNPPELIREVDLEEMKNELSMANEPGVDIDVGGLYEKLDRLETAVKEATQAAQAADRKLEELQ